MQIEDIYVALTVRQLKKEISETEKEKLFKWVYAAPENEKLYYSLKDIWETAKYAQIAEEANTEEEFEKLTLAAMQKKSVSFREQKSFKKKLYRVAQIAAIVVITFAIGFFVQKFLPADPIYSSVSVPYGAKSEVLLSDGSKIWLNSGTTLRYPSEIKDQSELFLEGEAFFDVVKNPKRRLNIKTSSINIQVLGTKFNVKSYNDEDIVETTLVNGAIAVTGNIGGRIIKDPILLKPNEQAVVTKSKRTVDVVNSDSNVIDDDMLTEEITETGETGEMEIIEPQLKIKEGLEVEPFVSWKDNKLVFKNERLEDLAVKIERWYNVEIQINDDHLKHLRYTGTFENETIEQAINALCISHPFSYEMNKNKIQINEKKITK